MRKPIQKNLLIVLCSYIIIACSDGANPTQEYPFLKKETEFKIDVPEPSGLALSQDKTFLWTVSDNTNRVYKIDFEGNILGELNYTGNDLEGIIQSPKDSTIWVAEEYLSQMVQLDVIGNVLNYVNINDAGGENGLEGICLDPTNNHFYLLKEKSPGRLIELDENFDLLQFEQINFANDFSGISYDSKNQVLWILSDQNEEVYEYSLSGSVLNTYSISVNKAEGIAIDSENDLIYIVSDSAEKLYIFSIQRNKEQ
ncbi:MAG: hypothetical protein D8M58_14320 [Calditrichaeota bacterium]|nr:MAG: hypothetical protein DWQ03_15560 [Calditrichota bacterium]MBL1206576.1 hypothetical protein [Calditrichota bacterium]NOG46403.1 hypothetical protein [Calditrichota bacterium]